MAIDNRFGGPWGCPPCCGCGTCGDGARRLHGNPIIEGDDPYEYAPRLRLKYRPPESLTVYNGFPRPIAEPAPHVAGIPAVVVVDLAAVVYPPGAHSSWYAITGDNPAVAIYYGDADLEAAGITLEWPESTYYLSGINSGPSSAGMTAGAPTIGEESIPFASRWNRGNGVLAFGDPLDGGNRESGVYVAVAFDCRLKDSYRYLDEVHYPILQTADVECKMLAGLVMKFGDLEFPEFPSNQYVGHRIGFVHQCWAPTAATASADSGGWLPAALDAPHFMATDRHHWDSPAGNDSFSIAGNGAPMTGGGLGDDHHGSLPLECVEPQWDE